MLISSPTNGKSEVLLTLNAGPRHEHLWDIEVQLHSFLYSALPYLYRFYTPEKGVRWGSHPVRTLWRREIPLEPDWDRSLFSSSSSPYCLI
jgi:hypothetical protein